MTSIREWIELLDEIIPLRNRGAEFDRLHKELCKKAKRLKLDIGKERTSSDKDRKANKADVDLYIKAINGTNKLVELEAREMETNLDDIVKHQERLDLERKENLKSERILELSKYGVIEFDNLGLDLMQDDVYSSFLSSKKVSFEEIKKAEVKAEADRIELEKVTNLQETRRFQCSRLVGYIENFETIDFGNMEDLDYENLVTLAKSKRDSFEKEQEQIRLDNEKLKKEREEAEITRIAEAKKVEDERLRVEKINNDKLESERLKAETEKKNIKVANDLKLKKEREENERLKKIESDRLEEEESKIQAKREAEKKALLAPDKEKLLLIHSDIENLITKISSISLSSEDSIKILGELRHNLLVIENEFVSKAKEL